MKTPPIAALFRGLVFLQSAALAVHAPVGRTQGESRGGLKARVFVAEFRDKTAGGSLDTFCLQNFNVTWKAIGEGMRDMMQTSLFESNRFQLVEREQLPEVIREQDLGASGRVKKGTEPAIGEISGADLMVVASVTEFDTGTKGLKGGVALGGVKVAGGARKAHMAIDIRVVDVKTSVIVVATSVEGSAANVSLDGSADSSGSRSVSLGKFAKTPLEKALRSCIQKAVQHICDKTPPDYFRHR